MCATGRINPNSEVENGRNGVFRGAHASGVWFSASRRKHLPAYFSLLEIPGSVWDESSGATPELARGTRALPIPIPASEFGLNPTVEQMADCLSLAVSGWGKHPIVIRIEKGDDFRWWIKKPNFGQIAMNSISHYPLVPTPQTLPAALFFSTHLLLTEKSSVTVEPGSSEATTENLTLRATEITMILKKIQVCAGVVMLIASSTQAQNLFVTDGSSILKITPSGVQSTFASGFKPQGLTFDSAGDLFASDIYGGNIYEYTPGGTRSTFASGLPSPTGLAFNSAGNLFEADWSGNIYEFTPDGEQTTFASGLCYPLQLAFQGETLPVPEPLALGLLAVGMFGITLLRRRQGYWKPRSKSLRMGWKSVRKGTNVNEALPLPERNRGRAGKTACKPVEQEENHEKGPRWSWAGNQMGNIK